MQNIREEKGYTYGIGSGFSYPGRYRLLHRVSADVRNDVIAALALEEIFAEIERIQTEPLTDEELNDARDGIVGEWVFGLETYQDFVEAVASYKIRGVELDRLNKLARPYQRCQRKKMCFRSPTTTSIPRTSLSSWSATPAKSRNNSRLSAR